MLILHPQSLLGGVKSSKLDPTGNRHSRTEAASPAQRFSLGKVVKFISASALPPFSTFNLRNIPFKTTSTIPNVKKSVSKRVSECHRNSYSFQSFFVLPSHLQANSKAALGVSKGSRGFEGVNGDRRLAGVSSLANSIGARCRMLIKFPAKKWL